MKKLVNCILGICSLLHLQTSIKVNYDLLRKNSIINLQGPLPEETPEEVQDMDEADVVRKKLFITNAQYKLAQIKRNLQ